MSPKYGKAALCLSLLYTVKHSTRSTKVYSFIFRWRIVYTATIYWPHIDGRLFVTVRIPYNAHELSVYGSPSNSLSMGELPTISPLPPSLPLPPQRYMRAQSSCSSPIDNLIHPPPTLTTNTFTLCTTNPAIMPAIALSI